MGRLAKVRANAVSRARRVRTVIRGTAERPRLSVNISHKHVSAQIIDDSTGSTLAHTTTAGQKVSGSITDKAVWSGKQIAGKAKKAGIKRVAFDRGSKKYHGRIKALAEAARNEGLEL